MSTAPGINEFKWVVNIFMVSFKGDWLLAMKFAERLCRESRWSKATYTYQKAAFLLTCDDHTKDTDTHIQYLFR